MQNVKRFDRGTIERVNPTSGQKRYRLKIARDGVFPYFRDGKIIREAKLDVDIFSDKTIESAKGAYITDGHPPEFVNINNQNQYAKGTILTAEQDGGYIVSDGIFNDIGLMRRVDSGEVVECSIGFGCNLILEPGEYKGAKFDAKQTDIVINHVAIVDQGRAGETVRVLDSAEFSGAGVMVSDQDVERLMASDNESQKKEPSAKESKTGAKMSTFTYNSLDGTSCQVDDSGRVILQDLNKLKSDAKGYETTVESLKAEQKQVIDSKDAKIAELEKSLEEVKGQRVDSNEIAKIIKQANEIGAVMATVDKEFKIDAMDLEPAMRHIVAKSGLLTADEKPEEMEGDALGAMYRAACAKLRADANDAGAGKSDSGASKEVMQRRSDMLDWHDPAVRAKYNKKVGDE